ncbi:uncharacterized protein MONBRDRAFT_23420 [Monosiga brevicollis MX1]|uniref:Uncharacterized protein n=1 Tax=Monosiga brevicollis TaxID=81824 RepID=A9UTC6_MONBE|nr:uncharacterized protein MONBRDRAFT_23420 [Monosiga brevicollis MX1]EDQ91468.1 predicted protein [Monosiga brevicollis MX1]|eukprot:XP_001743890.1 hypothetical protein [Monosiga brevicollis MX1]
MAAAAKGTQHKPRPDVSHTLDREKAAAPPPREDTRRRRAQVEELTLPANSQSNTSTTIPEQPAQAQTEADTKPARSVARGGTTANPSSDRSIFAASLNGAPPQRRREPRVIADQASDPHLATGTPRLERADAPPPEPEPELGSRPRTRSVHFHFSDHLEEESETDPSPLQTSATPTRASASHEKPDPEASVPSAAPSRHSSSSRASYARGARSSVGMDVEEESPFARVRPSQKRQVRLPVDEAHEDEGATGDTGRIVTRHEPSSSVSHHQADIDKDTLPRAHRVPYESISSEHMLEDSGFEVRERSTLINPHDSGFGEETSPERGADVGRSALKYGYSIKQNQSSPSIRPTQASPPGSPVASDRRRVSYGEPASHGSRRASVSEMERGRTLGSLTRPGGGRRERSPLAHDYRSRSPSPGAVLPLRYGSRTATPLSQLSTSATKPLTTQHSSSTTRESHLSRHASRQLSESDPDFALLNRLRALGASPEEIRLHEHELKRIRQLEKRGMGGSRHRVLKYSETLSMEER